LGRCASVVDCVGLVTTPWTGADPKTCSRATASAIVNRCTGGACETPGANGADCASASVVGTNCKAEVLRSQLLRLGRRCGHRVDRSLLQRQRRPAGIGAPRCTASAGDVRTCYHSSAGRQESSAACTSCNLDDICGSSCRRCPLPNVLCSEGYDSGASSMAVPACLNDAQVADGASVVEYGMCAGPSRPGEIRTARCTAFRSVSRVLCGGQACPQQRVHLDGFRLRDDRPGACGNRWRVDQQCDVQRHHRILRYPRRGGVRPRPCAFSRARRPQAALPCKSNANVSAADSGVQGPDFTSSSASTAVGTRAVTRILCRAAKNCNFATSACTTCNTNAQCGDAGNGLSTGSSDPLRARRSGHCMLGFRVPRLHQRRRQLRLKPARSAMRPADPLRTTISSAP